MNEVRGRYGLVYWQEDRGVDGVPSGYFYGYVEGAADKMEYFDPEDFEQHWRGVPQVVDSGDPNTVWPLSLRQDEVRELPPGLVSRRRQY